MEKWLEYADKKGRFTKNSSQLEALEIFMSHLLKRLHQACNELENVSQAMPEKSETLLQQSWHIIPIITKAHYIWDFFRTKLAQRFVPIFADTLLVSDLITHDCYREVMDKAEKVSANSKLGLRDYPLTYLLSGYSPITWPRNRQLKQIDYRILPIPIVGIPWDHIENPWEFLSLHHEVSHDIDVDLNELSQKLGLHLYQALNSKKVPDTRAGVWKRWSNEIFADFMGILLAGPPFVSFLASFMTLPPANTCDFSDSSAHPTPYLRVLLNAELIQRGTFGHESNVYIDRLKAEWIELYGQFSGNLTEFTRDFAIVIDTFFHTQFDNLLDSKGSKHTINELVTFCETDFNYQLKARDCFLNQNEIEFDIPIRHLVGAAYMASEQHLQQQIDMDVTFDEKLAEQMRNVVLKKAPKGKLPLRSQKSEEFLREMANNYFDSISEEK
jgi:hypothetical protein